MEQEFRIGDVVQFTGGARKELGSEEMTILSLLPVDARKKSSALCRWGQAQSIYPLSALRVVKLSEQPAIEEDINFLKGPMPSISFRLKLMEVALKHSTSPDHFLDHYHDLLFKVRYWMEQGSLAFVYNPDTPERDRLGGLALPTHDHFHQPLAGAPRDSG
jgi:hypothetical protein